MFFLKSGYKFAIAVTISAVLLICGCATSVDKRISMVYAQNIEYREWPDKILEKRFQEYWFNRFDGRVEDAYQIESPYLQEMIHLGKYNTYVKQTTRNKLANVEIQEITKETDSLISISCAIRTQSGVDRPVSTPIIDRWVFVGEKWYHVINDPILLSN